MKREQDGAIITQFDYPTCEALGLVKMDFLGLRNLTVLDDACRNIVSNGKEPVDLETLALDDRATYELLSRGDTLGVFQLDGGPMRALLRLMRPDSFEDISAVGALYRPGPMGAQSHTNYALRKNGKQPITPIHPELAEPLAEILDETYGLIVYQEQVLSIAQKVAGYSLGKADLLRRAMGKKKRSVLDAEFVALLRRDEGRRLLSGRDQDPLGHPRPVLRLRLQQGAQRRLRADLLLDGVPQGQLPSRVHGGPAHQRSRRQGQDRGLPGECRRMGIKVLPPDVNESEGDFTPVGTDVRFGLAAIRNVGGNVVEGIVAARAAEGRYETFPGLHGQGSCRRVQQAGRRVAGQGRCVRLAGLFPALAGDDLRRTPSTLSSRSQAQ